jgi:HD superfamily phosphohydrolase
LALTFVERVRDPLHGLIPLTACERDLLRTKSFSRLRGVRQMGMAYVVYSSAHHTRYEHVVGAMHTAWQLSRGLPIFSDRDLRLIRLGALSHDLGHRPFSHSLEDAARRFASEPGYDFLARYLDHEDHTWHLLTTDPEIRSVLERHPEYDDLSLEEIAQVATGRHPRQELNLFTHGEIDADRIDYVLRDNYYCGFAHGIDTQALVDLYVPDPDLGLVLGQRHVHVATQILYARYHLISQIQNNPDSRLGDLLLAECIREAFREADDARKATFDTIVNSGTDSDLEQFLRQHAPRRWADLHAMVAGQRPYRELAILDFPLLSPLARFALRSLQAPGESLAQRLQDRLTAETSTPYLIDRISISPPVSPLAIERGPHAPWHGRLTELNPIQGLVDASLEGVGLRVYAPSDCDLEADEARFPRWVERYQKVDPGMEPSRAYRALEQHWEGDRLTFGLLMALETIALELLDEQVARGRSRLVLLFLTCYSALALLEAAVGDPRLYLDGREAIAGLIRQPSLEPFLAEVLPARYAESGEMANDLRYLQRCGLLYAPARLERVRNIFSRRPKIGRTGWGKRLFRRLAESEASRTFLNRLEGAMSDLFAPHLEAYREYVTLLEEEGSGPATRRRELRRRMPVAFTR